MNLDRIRRDLLATPSLDPAEADRLVAELDRRLRELEAEVAAAFQWAAGGAHPAYTGPQAYVPPADRTEASAVLQAALAGITDEVVRLPSVVLPDPA